MPRAPRIHIVKGIYFVTLHASGTQTLIGDEDDRIELEGLIARACGPTRVRIHAYCWLPRQLHLAVQVSDIPLGAFIQRIAGAYAHRKQRHAHATGPLFAHRYEASPIPRLALSSLVRHTHRSPIRDGLVESAADHRWSSHRAYLGLAHTPWLTTTVLNTFAGPRSIAREAFDAFVNGNGARDSEFQRRLDEAAALRRALRKRVQRPMPFESLDEVINSVCRTQGVSREMLQARRKHTNADLARALIAWHATRSGLATLRQIAERLGRHPSTLTVAIDRQRAAHPHLFRHVARVPKSSVP
jgi:hypothetical protein